MKVYPKTIDLNASVEDPRIMGVIREQGGKVRLCSQLFLDWSFLVKAGLHFG